MKRYLLLIVLIINGILAQAQWTKIFYLDDFGDTTDIFFIEVESFDGLTYYNDPNTKPLDKFCVKIVIDEDKNVGFFMYENCAFEKNAYPGTSPFKEGTFRMRNSEGTTVKVNILGKFAKSGGLKLESDKFREFLTDSNGDIRCILKVGVAYHKFTLDATGYQKVIGK